MEYAKDEVFSISYNIEKDRLEYRNSNKYLNFIKKYKVMSLLISLGIAFSLTNFVLIYNFFNLLKTM